MAKLPKENEFGKLGGLFKFAKKCVDSYTGSTDREKEEMKIFLKNGHADFKRKGEIMASYKVVYFNKNSPTTKVTTTENGKDEAEVRKKMEKRSPGLKIVSIEKR